MGHGQQAVESEWLGVRSEGIWHQSSHKHNNLSAINSHSNSPLRNSIHFERVRAIFSASQQLIASNKTADVIALRNGQLIREGVPQSPPPLCS